MTAISTLFVDGNLSGDTTTYSIANRNGSGSDGNAYKTLGNGIAAAVAGDTIYIRAGTYAELNAADICFTLSKAVTLIAYNGESVTITYPVGNPPLVSAGEYGKIIQANDYFYLDGLTIIGTQDEGDSTGDPDITVGIGTDGYGVITNCTFQKYGHAAIKLADCNGLVIIGNTFEAGGFTTRDHHIYPSGDYRTSGLIIQDNEFTGATGWAIHLYGYAYGAQILSNNIHDNQGGILVTGESNTIDGNTITNNLGGSGIKFFHYGLIDLTVTDNACSGNTDYDLDLEVSAGEGFTNCTFSGNTGTDNFP